MRGKMMRLVNGWSKIGQTVDLPDAELVILVPHGMGTLLAQSHLRVSKLNLRPWGHSPLLTFFWLVHW